MSSSRVLPAQRVLPAARVVSASRVLSRRPVLGVYTTAEAGETLIPHLYDWVLRQEVGHQGISIPTSVAVPSTLTILSGVATTYIGFSPPYATWLFMHLESGTWWGFASVTVEEVGSAIFRLCAPDNSEVSLNVPGVYRVGEVVEVCARYNGSVMELYRNGALAGSRSYTGGIKSGSGALRIGARAGAPSFTTFVSHLVYYSRVVDPVYRGNRALDLDGMIVFLDPTFFDGSKYLDLSGNGNHGYPFGGATRAPASTTWLWRVRGLYSGDNKVRVLVPPMCRYRVGTGDWQVNDTWGTLELFLDPGLVSVVIEAL